METNTTESETTIVVFQDNGLESNGHDMLNQVEYSPDGDVYVAGSDKNNGTFLVPENFISQNSILGKDFVINCTPCNKIFVSADGYNSHIQVEYSQMNNAIFNSKRSYITKTPCWYL